MSLGDTLKGIVGKGADFIGGSYLAAGKLAKDVLDQHYGHKLSEAERNEFALRYQAQSTDLKLQSLRAWNEQEKIHNENVQQMEGTASDLLRIPILGPVMLFLRGAQRPCWGFFTLYADWQVLSKGWSYDAVPEEYARLYIILLLMINAVVLTVLFGEQALKNIYPLIERLLERWGLFNGGKK